MLTVIMYITQYRYTYMQVYAKLMLVTIPLAAGLGNKQRFMGGWQGRYWVGYTENA